MKFLNKSCYSYFCLFLYDLKHVLTHFICAAHVQLEMTRNVNKHF